MIRTKMFSLENSKTSHCPSGISSEPQIEDASVGCALPVKILRSVNNIGLPVPVRRMVEVRARLQALAPQSTRSPPPVIPRRCNFRPGAGTLRPMELGPGITCFLRADGGEVRSSASEQELRDALARSDTLAWVDIHTDGRDSGERILRDVFHFHQLTIDDCYNTLVDPPKVDDYGDYLFVIVHNLTYDGAIRRLDRAELDLYIGVNYVVSVHHKPVRAVEEVMRRAQAEHYVVQRGCAFLAHALMDMVVDDYQPIVETIDDDVAAIEELVLDNPRRETLQGVLRLKRSSQDLKRSILPQRDVVNRFSRGEYPRVIPPESLMYFRDIYDHTVRVEEQIETVRDLADSALNTYLSSVNNRINEVMKTLAIVTVIFLPLTLIAGIYGTNFHNVPEYGYHLGYYGMLVVMVVIAVALLAWFRWRYWI